jgi:Dullard-like phosphatase family protein
MKWGAKEDKIGRKSVIESKKIHNVLSNNKNNNIKKLTSSNSTEKKIDENSINNLKNKEEEDKKNSEIQKKREMSYHARKRIILRIRGTQEEAEEQQNVPKEKEEKNKLQKIRKIEIKLPTNNIKFKRVNSNNNINYNHDALYNNDFILFDKKKIRNNEIINEDKNKINNINDDRDLNKGIKNNFVFYKNIRNIYKKNVIKDISVLTDKNCKVLKAAKNCEENQSKTYNDEKINKLISKNKKNFNKKNKILNKEKKEKAKEYDNKTQYNNDNGVNNNSKNSHAILKYFESQRSKKYILNHNNQTSNIINFNDIYYSLNSSTKNLERVQSDFLITQKQNDKNFSNFKEKNKDDNDSKKKEKRKRIDSSEKRLLFSSSIFNNHQKKHNRINQSDINIENINHEVSEEKSKISKLDMNSHKTFKKELTETNLNNLNMINLRILPKHYLNNNKCNDNNIETEYFVGCANEKNDLLYKKLYIIHFFEELIDLNNSLENRSLLGTLLNNFNQKYYIIKDTYNNEFFKKFFKENENFEYIFKHFGIVLVCLMFLSKDETLYTNYLSDIKDLLIKLIYSSLNYVEIDGNKESNKIYNFINNNNFQSVIPNHRYILTLVNLLFDNKKEYLPLKDALEQLHNSIVKKDYIFLIKIINDSLLFCFNSKPRSSFNFQLFAFKNNVETFDNNEEQQLNNNNINFTNYYNSLMTNNISNDIHNSGKYTTNNSKNKNNKNIPKVPFIKSPMKKKFCLVLDIDETISHTLKLSFGGYFLLRPGAKKFLEETSKYYEIIIFTSSPKKYADKILNRIDINGNFISHRLYKTHVLFENGKTVKNLNMIGRDLTKTIFVDNLRSNAKYNLNNFCPITTWKSDIFDNRLIKLKEKLIYIATCGKYDNDITQGL